MTRVAILTGNAISLKVVSRHIATVLYEHGFNPLLYSNYNPDILKMPDLHGVIFFYPMDPVWCLNYAYMYYEAGKRVGDRRVFYTTVEGKPVPTIVRQMFLSKLEYVANSFYTKSKLEEVGLRVNEVIPHGFMREEVEDAHLHAEAIRKRMEGAAEGKVIFAALLASHRRKNVEGLEQALRCLAEQGVDDFVLFYLADRELNAPNCVRLGAYTGTERIKALALMAAADFTVFPSMSEGFGLPVLESSALGTPVVHGHFAPLTEHSPTDINITYMPERKEEWRPPPPKGGAIIFELHISPPEAIADAMRKAIEWIREDREGYEDACERLREKVKKYEIRNVYKSFIKYVE